MMKGANNSDFFFFSIFVLTFCSYGLLRRLAPRNDKKRTVIARVRRTRGNLVMGHSDNQTKLVITKAEDLWK